MPSPLFDRDLTGYGATPPDPQWPDHARVAVSFVVNFEEGAELSVSDGDERNEGVHEAKGVVAGVPDFCQDTHFGFGTRVAYWRVMDTLAASGVSATLSACGRAVERSPALVRDAIARGHEVSCHGWRWEQHFNMDAATEAAAIARTYDVITRTTGIKPLGWHTRSTPSVNTRRLLQEHGGFLYDSDAYDDELPYFAPGTDNRHVVIPYAFDTNDMHFHQSERFIRGADFAGYVIDAYDRLWREGAHQPKLLSVGLHLRMIGRAGRIDGLETVLRHMRQRGDTWFARRDAIARHWIERFGRPE